MDTRIVLILVAALVCAQMNAQQREHQGLAVDRATGHHLAVSGTAYIRVFAKSGDCPKFDEPSIPAVAVGNEFRFSIPANRSTYGAVFCRNGYFARIEPALSNDEREPRVRPYPLVMYALEDKQRVEGDVRDVLDRFVSDLRYLRSIDSDLFDKTIKRWADDHKFGELGSPLLSFFKHGPYPD